MTRAAAETKLALGTPRLLRLPPVAALIPGDAVGHSPYRVLGPWAEGGMGTLYEVAHDVLERRALMKVVAKRHRGDAAIAEQLVEEARLLERLRGTAVPTVFDAGVLDDGRPFFVMERLAGCDLRRELSRLGAFSVPSSLRVVTELLHALEELHGRGIVHADLKAENVLLTDTGRVVLLDLGAAVTAGSRRRELRVGTPRSMAPEQFGDGPIDARADIYAVGLLLFELLVGRGPYDARGACRDSLECAHVSQSPSAPSTRAPQRVPYELDAVVLRALAKRPEDRFTSADEMVTALLEASVREIDLDRTCDAWT